MASIRTDGACDGGGGEMCAEMASRVCHMVGVHSNSIIALLRIKDFKGEQMDTDSTARARTAVCELVGEKQQRVF